MGSSHMFNNIERKTLEERYLIICKELQELAPSAWQEVIDLCSILPSKINLKTVWQHGFTKPCYSNIKVKMGDRIASDLKNHGDFSSFEIIASEEWAIDLLHHGIDWRKNSNFRISGNLAQAYLKSLQRGGIASYIWRLYAVRQLAIALNNNNKIACLVEEWETNGRNCNGSQLTKWAKTFAHEVGMGWGYITTNHLLTDLGISIKPDLHVRRTAVRMGLLSPNISSELPTDKIDGLRNNVDEEIVIRLKELSNNITGTANPNINPPLREMDKTLMEWSRQDLIKPHF